MPLLLPFYDCLTTFDQNDVWQERDRFFQLTKTTLLLILGSCLFAIPVGVGLSVMLYRTDLPGRSLLRGLALWTLFLPLTMQVAGWQWTGFLGVIGSQSLLAAILLHALAGLPWVILLMGLTLQQVERELEEDALTCTTPRRVIWKVTLPRCRSAILASAIWIALQVFTDMAITDLLQVRTLAEEVYLQFTRPVANALTLDLRLLIGRAMAVTLPLFLLMSLSLYILIRCLSRNLPVEISSPNPMCFHTGKVSFFVLPLTLIVLGMPIISMLIQTLQGSSSLFTDAIRLEGTALIRHVTVSASVGGLTTFIALILCSLAREKRFWRVFLMMLMILAWALPGPVVGLSLKRWIHLLLDLTHWRWLEDVLHYGPSSVPVIWAQSIRLLPFAVIFLWPTLRQLPQRLLESARIDGANFSQEWRYIIWPWMRRACLLSLLLVSALSFGELSASELVSTPGAETFVEELFAQMHYRLAPELAARCLLFLMVIGVYLFVFSMLTSRKEPSLPSV